MKKTKRNNLLITVFLIAACLGLTHCSSRATPQIQPAVDSTAKQQTAGEENLQAQTGAAGENTEPAAADSETPNELLEQALAAYQDAQTAWEEGETDSALDALDEAYNNIIKVEVSQDSPLIQEKNNLRLMIAQRIQEIYTSRSDKVINNHQSIPLVENKYILAEIKLFQTRQRESFLAAYKRSGRYRHMILKELKKAGLPEELSWIPVVESWFKVRAYSRARALGLWQFISSTGYRFGLKKDRWVDERMDPEKATRAAVKYLDELHSLFGDWTSALASYNCGEFQVQRVIRAQRINYLDNFWDLFVMLPRETARFVPRIIATIMIIKNPEKYGFELPDPDPPLRYEIVLINKAVKLSTLSQVLGLQGDELAALNPELRHNATPDREYHIKVPDGYGRRTLTAIPSLSRWIPAAASYSIHRVRRGETVSGIARRYRTSVSAISRLNRLRRNYMIRPGQRLKVPSRGGRSYRQVSYSPKNLKPRKSKPAGADAYIVQRGDTPYTIARKFGMRLEKLLSINGLGRRSRIYPGQKLWVSSKN